MTQEFSRDDYAACLNTDFSVHLGPESTVTMKLIEVTEASERFRQITFSLLFQAPDDTPVEQRMYEVENEKLGKAELFLVPVGKDDRGVMFESVFNRLLPRV